MKYQRFSPARVAKQAVFVYAFFVNFLRSIKSLFGASRSFDEIKNGLEELLIAADVGPTATDRLLTKLAQNKNAATTDNAIAALKNEMLEILTLRDLSNASRFTLHASQNKPTVIYFIGVNGSGKTTTIAKFAHFFTNNKTSTLQHLNTSTRVLLIAADTFRAAAIDQLKVWADRVGADFVGGQTGADPSSVIVDGLRSAKSSGLSVVLIDTAGRLQTKQNLIQELQKMVRMTEKELGKKPDEIFLVIDAMTGHNGLSQALVFCEAIPVTGIILTKYDSTAKGGVVFAIVEETRLPIRYIGTGEGLVDLKMFEAKEFVDLMFA